MTTKATTNFEIATWYDTWNQTGLDNLVNKIIPLNYASRYNLAFGQLVPVVAGGHTFGYTLDMNGPCAAAVKLQIQTQAPGVVIYVGLGAEGMAETVRDNRENNNRSTSNIVEYLHANGYSGLCIDNEDTGHWENGKWIEGSMKDVPEFISQLGPSFKAAGLGLAVSAPWPGRGPIDLFGDNAVESLNEYADYVELQDYASQGGTPSIVPVWTNAGVKASILMGGVCTENSGYQTSLPDTQSWTQYAMQHGLRGMFSWRLDNDHGSAGTEEDIGPTCVGAQTVYNTVIGGNAE